MEQHNGASGFDSLDIAVFGAYCLLVISVALYVSFKNKKKDKKLIWIKDFPQSKRFAKNLVMIWK
jgi:hypothetical protein